MQHWRTVFLYEFTRQVRRKSFWVVALGIPFLGALVLAGVLGYQELKERTEEATEAEEAEFEGADPVGFVDESGLFAAPSDDSGFKGYVVAYQDASDGEAALKAEEISTLYIIAPDYLESGKVTALIPHVSFSALEQDLMEAYLAQSLAGDVDPLVAYRLRTSVTRVDEQKLDKDGNRQQGDNLNVNFLVVYVYAMVLMLTIFMSSGYLMQSVVEEKESKAIEIVLTSVKPFPLLLGKTVAMGLTGLIQVAIWAVAAYALFNIAASNVVDLSGATIEPATMLIAVVYFFLGFGVVGGVFAAMGTIVGNTRDGSQLVGWVVFPFISPLFFVTAFANSPDGTLARVMSLIPFTSPLAMLMRSSVSSVPLWELVLSIGLTSLLMIASIWMAGRVFRVQSLLRGSAIKWRELPKLILEG